MTTSKPRTEVPPIKPVNDQTFILTNEEVLQACANFVIEQRRNCRFTNLPAYTIHGGPGTVTITLRDTK